MAGSASKAMRDCIVYPHPLPLVTQEYEMKQPTIHSLMSPKMTSIGTPRLPKPTSPHT